MMGLIRAAFVIGRRDFVASVWSRAFLLFLMGPLVMIAIGIAFGNVSEKMAQEDIHPSVAVIASKADFAALADARERLNAAFGQTRLPDLKRSDAEGPADAQVKKLLDSSEGGVVAVLTGGIDEPTLTGAVSANGLVTRQMTLVLEEARQRRALAGADLAPDVRIVSTVESGGSRAAVQALTARAGQLILFTLTVLLAGMLLSNLIEEKSNKVIEVLAAAVPVDAIFLGKLFAMLAVSLVGIMVWTSFGLGAASLLLKGGGPLPEPALGWPLFLLFVLAYFAANYLLLGALFLGIGSQASSVREVQTLSMPVTIGQVLVFFFASAGASPPGNPIGLAAAIFPFSSPLAMIARAAQSGDLWPHALALLWQGLWVWQTIKFGASLFRRNVLKSGGPRRGLFRRKPA
jgi:ABC-2 type transport system permease protein